MSEPPGYFNTNELTGARLAAADAKALTQEEAVLRHFRRHPGLYLTPDQVLAVMAPRTPLTSVRRAMTNLTTRGLLVKTDRLKEGPYGSPAHCWVLAGIYREQAQLEFDGPGAESNRAAAHGPGPAEAARAEQ